jgi:exosortase
MVLDVLSFPQPMAPSSMSTHPHRLSRVAYALPVVTLGLAIYGKPLTGLIREWWSPGHSQSLVIFVFAALVAWLRRRTVSAIPSSYQPQGLLLAGAGCALHVFGQIALGAYASQLSFLLVVSGIIWTFWGIGRLRAFALPISLLAAAIPLPSLVYDSLSFPLQMLATTIACWAADLAGIAIYREGNIIHLAGMSVGVWEACNGLNSLKALLAGSVVLAFLVCRLPLTRILVCAAAFPVAVIANVVRVTGTAMLSDWHPVYAIGFYHAFSGWMIFLLGAIALYGAAFSMRKLLEK